MMKRTKFLLVACLIVIMVCIQAIMSFAKIPEPDNIIFGTVKINEFLLTSNYSFNTETNTITVTLNINSNPNSVASYTMGAAPEAGNFFILDVPIDALDPQEPGTARPGDEAIIYINGEEVKTIHISERGDIHRIDLAAGDFNDTDVDGLADIIEQSLGTDPNNFDSDGDGLTDGDEVNKYGTNPLNGDTDGDGVSDGFEFSLIFTAGITATGQGEEHGLIGANNESIIYIGLDTNVSTLETDGPLSNSTVYMTVSENLIEDIREIKSFSEEWILNIDIGEYADPNLEGYYPVLSWDSTEFCPKDAISEFKLYSLDNESESTLIVDDMYETNWYQTKEEEFLCDTNVIPNKCRSMYSVFVSWSNFISIEMDLLAGWSMISLPLIPNNAKLSELFPGAMVVYGYKKGVGYNRVERNEELLPGDGYWILLDQNQTYILNGQSFQSYTLPVSENGWSMIGGCTNSAKATSDRCNIDVIYGFIPGFGYQRVSEKEDLIPGKGYWILFNNVIGEGELRVEATGPNP